MRTGAHGRTVLSWESTSDGVRVQTAARVYHADQPVVTAGEWSGKRVPELAPHLSPECQIPCWFEVADPTLFAPSSVPVFQQDADDRTYNGFPEFSIPGFKIGR